MPEGSGKQLWEKIYNDSVAAGDSKEKAAKKAWGGIKNAGWKKNANGEWVKDSVFADFSMRIEKASLDKGEEITMRWRAVASDTDPDLYEESMSLDLFNDFADRIKNNTPVPEPFKSIVCEDTWCGGMPYISLAHYKSGTDKRNVPGEIEETFVDGTYLKSKGILNKSPLGYAVFDALNKDLYAKKSDGTPVVPPEQHIRVSIGFLDLEHKHVLEDGTTQIFERKDLNQVCHLCNTGIGRKIYTKGQLVHEALTRVPVNPRTLMEVDKSMDIKSKKDDAESIIGKDLVEELEAKSLANDILVIKADGTVEPMDIPDDMDKCFDPNTAGYDQDCVDNLMMGHMPAMRKEMKAELRKSDTVSKSMTKAEAWGNEPASSYLVVKDPQHPTDWHLPVKKHGKVDTGLMGAAHAALTSNHRGKAYGGPDKAKATAKLHSMYNSHGLDWEKEEKSLRAMSEEALGIFMEEAMADVKGAMKDKNPSPQVKDRFEDEDLAESDASDEEMGQGKGKGKVSLNEQKSRKSVEAAEGESADEEKKEGKKGEKAEEKALTSAFDKVTAKVVELRSRGIVGKAAEPYLQPLLNEAAGEIEKSLSVPASPTMEGVAEVMRSTMEEALAPVMQEIASIKAQLRSNPTGGPTQQSMPVPRGIKFDMTRRSVPTGKPMRELSQIEKIARATTGADR